jgi:phosphate:Na+ symporter
MSKTMNPLSLAVVNTLFRLAMLCMLLPFADVLEALVKLMVRDKTNTEDDPTLRLEERFLQYPALAVEQSRLTINEMAEESKQALLTALTLVTDFSDAGYASVQKAESAVDRYEDALGSYLLRLTSTSLNETQGQTISIFLHTLSDFERISDHALNLAESAKELKEKKITFSEYAQKEFTVIFAAVREVVQLTADAFHTDDLTKAAQIEPLEEVIDLICDEMKLHHIERLQTANCTIRQGFVFNDLITNLERVSDHCSNIAVAMIELNAGTFDTHEYLDRLKQQRTADYERYFNEFREQFAL